MAREHARSKSEEANLKESDAFHAPDVGAESLQNVGRQPFLKHSGPTGHDSAGDCAVEAKFGQRG